jgi:membrane-associated phospholipid phosphatase
MKLILVIVLLFSRPVYADERKVADIISYGTVAAQLTFNTIYNWHEPDRKKAIVMEVTKTFFTIAASETLKQFIHEERPDKSDSLSFPSEHSAIASANMGYSYRVGFSLTFTTMAGRVIAKKHHWWDTVAGAGIGMLVDQFIR